MICTNCGKYNTDDATVCSDCGKTLDYSSMDYTSPAYNRQNNYQRRNVLPKEYKPLSPWAYFGYQLLFSIPLVGFILLIVFSCGGTSNVNLKNFARSYWCSLLISVILIVVAVVLLIVTGGMAALVESMEYYY